MRKRLGSLEKAPIEKLEQSLTTKSLAIFSCLIALVIVHFGVNLGVDILNFLNENTGGGNRYILHEDNVVWYTKGILGIISVTFIFSRQS